jgi:hypothetical protein
MKEASDLMYNNKNTINIALNIILNSLLLLVFLSLSVLRFAANPVNDLDMSYFWISEFALPPLVIILQIILKNKFKSDRKKLDMAIFLIPFIISLLIIGFEYIFMMIPASWFIRT